MTLFISYNMRLGKKQIYLVDKKGWKKWSKLTNYCKRHIILKYE